MRLVIEGRQGRKFVEYTREERARQAVIIDLLSYYERFSSLARSISGDPDGAIRAAVDDWLNERESMLDKYYWPEDEHER